MANEIEQILLDIIDTAIAITQADFGNIQLLDPTTGDLRIVVQRGFSKSWLNYWTNVSKGKGTCGTALEKRERVIIEDICESPIFIGTEALKVQLEVGVRSVQSTPIIGRSGKILGMFSTHYKKPHQLDQNTIKILDVFVKQVADSIELLETQALLKSIMESSSEYSIMALDLEGVIVAWNVGAENLYGYHSFEIIGKKADPLYDQQEFLSGKVQSAFDIALHEGKWSGLLQRIRKSGDNFHAFVTITSRKDANNIVIGYTLISRDLTDLENVLNILNWLKTSEAMLKNTNMQLAKELLELQNVDRLKNEFIENVSHELRTPLNGIIGFTELLYNGTIDTDGLKYKEYLGDILSSARQLLLLIDGILEFAQIEANKLEFNPVQVDLQKLMKEVEGDFQSLIIKKNIYFAINIDHLINNITIDREKFKGVINNFISNALKFTPDGGQVNVSIYPVNKKEFCLEVQDNGIGIRKKDFNKLFQKFQQLNVGMGKEYQGIGLGLALVKHVVEAQGGRVNVESTFGKGSIFYAILPNQDVL